MRSLCFEGGRRILREDIWKTRRLQPGDQIMVVVGVLGRRSEGLYGVYEEVRCTVSSQRYSVQPGLI